MRKLLLPLMFFVLVSVMGQQPTTTFNRIAFLAGGSLYKINQTADSIAFDGIYYSAPWRRKYLNSVHWIIPKYNDDRIKYPGIRQYSVHLPVTKRSLLIYNPIDQGIYGQDEEPTGPGVVGIENIDVSKITSYDYQGDTIPTIFQKIALQNPPSNASPISLAAISADGEIQKSSFSSMLFPDSCWIRNQLTNTVKLRYPEDSLALPFKTFFPYTIGRISTFHATRSNQYAQLFLGAGLGTGSMSLRSVSANPDNTISMNNWLNMNAIGTWVNVSDATNSASYIFSPYSFSGNKSLGDVNNKWNGAYLNNPVYLGGIPEDTNPLYVYTNTVNEMTSGKVSKYPISNFSLTNHNHDLQYEPKTYNPTGLGWYYYATPGSGSGTRYWIKMPSTGKIMLSGSNGFDSLTNNSAKWNLAQDSTKNPWKYVGGNTVQRNAGNLGIGTSNPPALLSIYGSSNGATSAYLQNDNTGTAASSAFTIGNSPLSSPFDAIYINHYGVNFASAGAKFASGSYFMAGAGATGGLSVGAANASGDLRMYAGGTTAPKMIIKSDGRIGLGTTNPSNTFTITGDGISQPIAIYSYYSAALAAPIISYSARGSVTSPTAIQNGDALIGMNGKGYGSTGFSSGGRIQFYGKAGENWTDAAQGAYFGISTTQNGTIVTAERLRITGDGNFGFNTSTPTAVLDVNSDIIRVRTAKTPVSATAAGNQGDIAWDASYIYVCVATNTWKRSAISTW